MTRLILEDNSTHPVTPTSIKSSTEWCRYLNKSTHLTCLDDSTYPVTIIFHQIFSRAMPLLGWIDSYCPLGWVDLSSKTARLILWPLSSIKSSAERRLYLCKSTLVVCLDGSTYPRRQVDSSYALSSNRISHRRLFLFGWLDLPPKTGRLMLQIALFPY